MGQFSDAEACLLFCFGEFWESGLKVGHFSSEPLIELLMRRLSCSAEI